MANLFQFRLELMDPRLIQVSLFNIRCAINIGLQPFITGCHVRQGLCFITGCHVRQGLWHEHQLMSLSANKILCKTKPSCLSFYFHYSTPIFSDHMTSTVQYTHSVTITMLNDTLICVQRYASTQKVQFDVGSETGFGG